MSLSNKRELSLLKHDEAEVVRTTHYPAIQELDRKAIAEARRKLTTLRDTEKTFARQKAREAAASRHGPVSPAHLRPDARHRLA